MFYGYNKEGGIVFASEAKNLTDLCDRIMPFPPGHYYVDGEFVRYTDITTVNHYNADDMETVCQKIHAPVGTARR